MLAEMKKSVDAMVRRPRLAIVSVGANPVIERFVAQKKRAAEEIGIAVRIYTFEKEILEDKLYRSIARIQSDKTNTGVIIQLPLPRHLDTQRILDAVDPAKDIDLLSSRAIGAFASGQSAILPPVVGAIRTILAAYRIKLKGKKIAVLGAGRLVGMPLALWLQTQGATFSVIQKGAGDIARHTKDADILISGVGKPGIVTARLVKKGAILLDAGTSEIRGKIAGDIDTESVRGSAAYLAPVPGGIGPLTVCMVLKNLLMLSEKQ